MPPIAPYDKDYVKETHIRPFASILTNNRMQGANGLSNLCESYFFARDGSHLARPFPGECPTRMCIFRVGSASGRIYWQYFGKPTARFSPLLSAPSVPTFVLEWDRASCIRIMSYLPCEPNSTFPGIWYTFNAVFNHYYPSLVSNIVAPWGQVKAMHLGTNSRRRIAGTPYRSWYSLVRPREEAAPDLPPRARPVSSPIYTVFSEETR